MDFSFIYTYYPYFIEGAKVTLTLSFFTIIFGVVLGLLFALIRMSKFAPLRFAATAYIEFIRGTPFLVQLYLIYYGLPQIGIEFPDKIAAVIALSINSSAYVAETFRAGIQGIDRGQMEAARSLGLSHWTAMRWIILPQAMRNVLPALGNEFIIIIKDSSLVSVIGIAELMYKTDTVKTITYKAFEPLIVVACIYFIMTFTLSKLLGRFERRLKASD